jgi:hypothetical protein
VILEDLWVLTEKMNLQDVAVLVIYSVLLRPD